MWESFRSHNDHSFDCQSWCSFQIDWIRKQPLSPLTPTCISPVHLHQLEVSFPRGSRTTIYKSIHWLQEGEYFQNPQQSAGEGCLELLIFSLVHMSPGFLNSMSSIIVGLVPIFKIVWCPKLFCINVVIEIYSIVQNLCVIPNQKGELQSLIFLRVLLRNNSTNTNTQCTLRMWIMHWSWLLEGDSTKWNTYVLYKQPCSIFDWITVSEYEIFGKFLVTQFNMDLLLSFIGWRSRNILLRLSMRECLNVSCYSQS